MVLERGVVPHTRHVRGSNYCQLNVWPDRIPGRAIITSCVSVQPPLDLEILCRVRHQATQR